MDQIKKWLKFLNVEHQAIGRTIQRMCDNPENIRIQELYVLKSDFEYCVREVTRIKELLENENRDSGAWGRESIILTVAETKTQLGEFHNGRY
jgi:hypothetical protein